MHFHEWLLTIGSKTSFVVHCRTCSARFVPAAGQIAWTGPVPEKLQ
jgi:hypothetical protein